MDTVLSGREKSSERLTYSVIEAAALLGIGRVLAYELVRTGKLRTVRLGRRIVVPKRALDELLNL
jgi:excisionase family DNA binding protein